MARGSRYKVSFRRRREGKTDYKARLSLIDIDKSRLVVRITNNHVIAQVINVAEMGDETLVSAHSKELEKMGWKAGTKNTAAAYLTGYLCAKKALSKGIEYAVLDIGLKSSIRGSKIFAVLKGAADAGLNVPHGESILPDESRIKGEHIAEYAQSLDDEQLKQKFSQYLDKGISPSDLPEHFEEIRKKIDEAEV
ncbi:50S ribosomal protein L18 [Methanobacterium alkalithermotolerans]|uniref:Large ribosomal subunit protein uL18 n=1 Tax=Methanobacterium alkalithermotolerans TaxID=2731220 RepID=A0A8T8K9Z7_9EURY|nr:50S ribosomal protein L18 [Methanobacterium alkalithermotolerans]QUH23923.1 50S ribosomal protein L18 [Methanobacterium alkalithermotolerans]